MIADRPAVKRPSVDRLVRAVRRVSRLILWLAGSALAGGAAIWLAIWNRLGPSEHRTASLVVWALILLAPPAMLVVLHLALEQLIVLPAHLRALPARARRHAAQVGRLATEAGSLRDRGMIRTALAVIKLWRAAASARNLLQMAAPVTFLLSPAMIAASMLALAAAAAEIAVGTVACVVLVLG
jgi:hypothetical protein